MDQLKSALAATSPDRRSTWKSVKPLSRPFLALAMLELTSCAVFRIQKNIVVNDVGTVSNSRALVACDNMASRLPFNSRVTGDSTFILKNVGDPSFFDDINIHVKTDSASVTLSFYKERNDGREKLLDANEYLFYGQAFKQELDSTYLKNCGQCEIKPINSGISLSLAATLPEIMPFYNHNGVTEPRNRLGWPIIFAGMDLYSIASISDDRSSDLEIIEGISGLLITRLFALVISEYDLVRNREFSKSGYKFKR
jgi:hypothetical protein